MPADFAEVPEKAKFSTYGDLPRSRQIAAKSIGAAKPSMRHEVGSCHGVSWREIH